MRNDEIMLSATISMKLPHARVDGIFSRTHEFTVKGRTRALNVAVSLAGGSSATGSGNGSAQICQPAPVQKPVASQHQEWEIKT
jgi:hypothetical protein